MPTVGSHLACSLETCATSRLCLTMSAQQQWTLPSHMTTTTIYRHHRNKKQKQHSPAPMCSTKQQRSYLETFSSPRRRPISSVAIVESWNTGAKSLDVCVCERQRQLAFSLVAIASTEGDGKACRNALTVSGSPHSACGAGARFVRCGIHTVDAHSVALCVCVCVRTAHCVCGRGILRYNYRYVWYPVCLTMECRLSDVQ